MWNLEGFNESGELVEEHALPNVDDETICTVLGLKDIRFYAGGSYRVSKQGKILLADRCTLLLRDDLRYSIEYNQDYPGQHIAYLVDETTDDRS